MAFEGAGACWANNSSYFSTGGATDINSLILYLGILFNKKVFKNHFEEFVSHVKRLLQASEFYHKTWAAAIYLKKVMIIQQVSGTQ